MDIPGESDGPVAEVVSAGVALHLLQAEIFLGNSSSIRFNLSVVLRIGLEVVGAGGSADAVV